MPGDPRLERVIAIVGADHSGSTMLGCAIGAEDDPFRSFHVGELHAHFDPHGRDGPGHAPFWRKIDRELGPSTAYQQIVEVTGAQAIVDSSKNLTWITNQASVLAERGVPLDIVIAVRPNAALIHSVLKRGLPESQAVRSVLYYQNLLDELRNWQFRNAVAVDCDEFCRNPSSQLRSLCAAIEIPYFPGKELYWNFKHYNLFGASIQRQQMSGVIPGGYREPLSENHRQLEYARQVNLKHRLKPVWDIVHSIGLLSLA